MGHVILWDGPGWYADLGRWDSDGKSYVEGCRIASPEEYDESGYEVDYPDDADYSPYIWDKNTGRGTPYWLAEKPENAV